MPTRTIKTKFFTFFQDCLYKKPKTNPSLGINKVIILESIDSEMAKYQLEKLVGYKCWIGNKDCYNGIYGLYFEPVKGENTLNKLKEILYIKDDPNKEYDNISIHYFNGKIVNIEKRERIFVKKKNFVFEIINKQD